MLCIILSLPGSCSSYQLPGQGPFVPEVLQQNAAFGCQHQVFSTIAAGHRAVPADDLAKPLTPNLLQPMASTLLWQLLELTQRMRYAGLLFCRSPALMLEYDGIYSA